MAHFLSEVAKHKLLQTFKHPATGKEKNEILMMFN
jgi:hypothetical protein